MVLFFTHIPFVVNHTINETPPERLQHYVSLWYSTKPVPFNSRVVHKSKVCTAYELTQLDKCLCEQIAFYPSNWPGWPAEIVSISVPKRLQSLTIKIRVAMLRS